MGAYRNRKKIIRQQDGRKQRSQHDHATGACARAPTIIHVGGLLFLRFCYFDIASILHDEKHPIHMRSQTEDLMYHKYRFTLQKLVF